MTFSGTKIGGRFFLFSNKQRHVPASSSKRAGSVRRLGGTRTNKIGPVTAPKDSVTRRLLWLLPAVFVIHDGEELATMPAWLSGHRALLDSLALRGRIAARVAASAPATSARAAVAIGLVFAVLLLVTAGATWSRARAWFYAYCSLLGLLFLHVFTHVAQALVFRSYVPGLVGAVFVVLPGTMLIYRRLFAVGLLDWKTAILTGLGGFALFVPGVLAAWAVGRMLAG